MPAEQRFLNDQQEVVTSGKCQVTGQEYSVTVPLDQFKRWQGGELIQRAMPDLNAEQREFLISGTTPEEWSDMVQKWEAQEKGFGSGMG